VVTPARQWPTIIVYDCSAEFRYDREPVGADLLHS
jgi:hypothetical protein